MVTQYIPARGDIVWLEFTPQTGHEQAGRRPALVISPEAYNAKTGLMLACPITSRIKGYPFEVAHTGDIKGVILADQVKSLDWRARKAEFVEETSEDAVGEVIEKIQMLLF